MMYGEKPIQGCHFWIVIRQSFVITNPRTDEFEL
jgi:hypothetical protein